MEIERKWLINRLSEETKSFPHEEIEQFYISTADPVIRLRSCGNRYFLTVKGSGRLKRDEYEFETDRSYYEKMSSKSEGITIKKTRYRQPVLSSQKEYIAEIDVFKGYYEGLIYAEVEFGSEEEAMAFIVPEWFGKEVTFEKGYSNAELALGLLPDKYQMPACLQAPPTSRLNRRSFSPH